MKILLLGHNHASTMNSLKVGLEENGVDVRAISYDLNRSVYCNYSDIHCIYPSFLTSKKRILKGILWRFYATKSLIRLVFNLIRADVVINFSFPALQLFYDTSLQSSFELYLIDKCVKRKFVWFTGSDIRNPEIDLSINPYFKHAWENPGYEYRLSESAENSDRLQSLFKKYHFSAIVWDMSEFINKNIFLNHIIVPHASFLNIPQTHNPSSKIRIVHAPSAPVAKGSNFIIPVIERLQKERNDFEFHLLQDISNKEYQLKLAEADVLIDQIIWGGYGVASMQALEAGKVVLAYLWESRINQIYGAHCPVVNVNPDTLYQKLNEILDSKDLDRIKRSGQDYYQNLHSPTVVAKMLLDKISNNIT